MLFQSDSILGAVKRVFRAGGSSHYSVLGPERPEFDPRHWPKVGVGVLVVRGQKVLLGKRRGSHGEGEYSSPGGHMEYMESFEQCAHREVHEEAGIEVCNIRLLRVSNSLQYLPKHYVDIEVAADWVKGEARVLEPDRIEHWDWFDIDNLPQPLFSSIATSVQAYRSGHIVWDP